MLRVAPTRGVDITIDITIDIALRTNAPVVKETPPIGSFMPSRLPPLLVRPDQQSQKLNRHFVQKASLIAGSS